MKFKLLIVLSALFNTLYSQNLDCVKALQKISLDSLTSKLQVLVGKKNINIDGADKKITSRYAYHADNVFAEKYLFEECKNLGYEVFKNTFSDNGGNIIAYKTGNKSPKEVYMICAHYDCVGSSRNPFQGADDNASGCAAVLEAARVLKNYQFPFTIAFAFWDEEELGLLGSAAFAPMGPYEWFIQGVINLDMIAYDSNNDSLVNIHVFPTNSSIQLGQTVKNCNSWYGIGLNPVIINPGTQDSDNFSFSRRNVTAMAITEDYGPDFNPHWHKLSDSLENCNIDYFFKTTKLAISSICHLAANNESVGIKNNSLIKQSSFDLLFVGKNLIIKGLDSEKLIKIKIYNLMGQLLQETYIENEIIPLNFEVNNEIYLLFLESDNLNYTFKFKLAN